MAINPIEAYEHSRLNSLTVDTQRQERISRGGAEDPFGADFIGSGSSKRGEGPSLYGADARLRSAGEASLSEAAGPVGADGSRISSEDREMLRKLEDRDAKVRAHETAHVMAAGGQAGPVNYVYQNGPDGRGYAVGGSVNISIISSGGGEESVRQAETASRAALAAGEASLQDNLTAAKASELAARARRDSFDDYI